jgi:hypothetical protein
MGDDGDLSLPSPPNTFPPLVRSVSVSSARCRPSPIPRPSVLVSVSPLPSCRPSRHSPTILPCQCRLVHPPLPIFARCTDPGPSSPAPPPLFRFFLHGCHDRRQPPPPPPPRPSWSFLPSQLESSIPQHPSLSCFNTSCLSSLHTHVRAHTHTRLHLYTCVHVHTRTCTCMHTCMHVDLCTRVYTCMHARARAQMNVCACLHVSTRAQACAQACTQMQAQAHTQAHNMQVNVLVCTWASSTNDGPFWPLFWFFDFV